MNLHISDVQLAIRFNSIRLLNVFKEMQLKLMLGLHSLQE